jgi:hypothetical protein
VTDHPPSVAERLDRAVDALRDGALPAAAAARAGLGVVDRPLVDVADRLGAALPVTPAAPRFDARLGARLATVDAAPAAVAWARRHPGTLIGGALGSAVGVGVTAYAVWRSGRRPGGAHRLLHR